MRSFYSINFDRIKSNLILISFLALLLSPVAGFTTNYYVATTGADSNPGTVGLPKQTISNAIANAAANDTINVAGGTYNELLSINKTLVFRGAGVGIPGTGSRPATETILIAPASGGNLLLNLSGPVTANFDGFLIDGANVVGVTQPGESLMITNSVLELDFNPGSNNIFFSSVQLTLTQNYFKAIAGVNDGGSSHIFMSGGALSCADNKFTSEAAISSYSATTTSLPVWLNITTNTTAAVIDNNSFTKIDLGILLADNAGGVVIKHNDFDQAKRSAYTGGSSYGAGIAIFNTLNPASPIIIRNNNFKTSETGIRTSSVGTPQNFPPPALLKIIDNSFSNIGATGAIRLGADYNSSSNKLNALCNWFDNITGPQITSNPGGGGSVIVDPAGKVNYKTWLNYGTDASPSLAGFQLPTAINVAPGSNTSIAQNHYRVLANAVGCAVSGQTLTLAGTFDISNTTAKAAWVRGNDGDLNTDDDYSINCAYNVSGVTVTAASLGSAIIRGQGEMNTPGFELEAAFSMYYPAPAYPSSGLNQNWTFSNLQIEAFELSIGMFNDNQGSTVFNGTKIINNKFIVPKDLNSITAPDDGSQNIGIHYSFGANQEISGNMFEVEGDGISNDGSSKYSSTVILQSNTSGGAVYSGLQIKNNNIVITGVPDATAPAVIRGIWENGQNQNASIDISGNKFSNQNPANTADKNRQTAFWVTSRSGVVNKVLYSNNEVSDFKEGIAWLGGLYTGNAPPDYEAGASPVEIRNNKFDRTLNAITTRKPGAAANAGSPGYAEQNSFTNFVAGGFAIRNEGSGTASSVCNWYGTTSFTSASALNSGPVNILSILNSGADGNAATGFQPTGSCVQPVHNLTQNTYYLTIQSAIAAANANDVIELSEATFNERVVIDKSLTLQGITEANCILSGTGLPGTGNGITINTGITGVTIQRLTIQNFSGAGGNANGGIYAPGGNNNLNVNHVTIQNNTGGSGFYANGPITNVTIDNVTSSGHGGGARGIVIWNGLKENITITNCNVFNNNCCGIELQDGTASGVTMTGNNIHDNSDNGFGLVGLQGPGENLINNNIITNNGRFGIEVKNPNGTGLSTGAGRIVVSGNTVTRTNPIGAETRDLAGIAVYRRGVLAGNVDVPTGVVVSGNTVSGFQQPSTSEGFGIVAEGTNQIVTGNNVSGNDVGIQRQAGHLPYPADGDQTNVADTYFGRGNSQVACGINVSGNTLSNSIDTRDVPSTIATQTGYVLNTNTGKTFCTIQAAINDAATLNTHILQVNSGTYDEQVLVNKQVRLVGVGASRPVVKFTGTVTGKPVLLDISVPNVTIENLQLDVDLVKLSGGIVASGSNLDNLVIKSNLINATSSSAAGSRAPYGDLNAVSINYTGGTNYRFASGGVNNILFQGNTVTGSVMDAFGQFRFFRAGISADEAGGTFTGNTIQSINQDIQVRFGSNGNINVTNNFINGGGVNLTEYNAGAGTINVAGNTFNGTFANAVVTPRTALLRLQNNQNAKTTVVSGNTFINHLWAISLENYNTVSIDNNSFTPLTGSTDFVHIGENTKTISSNSNTIVQTTVGGSFTRNIFNGSGTTGGTAIGFYNHDADNASFGTFTIGGSAANANDFKAQIAQFIRLDNQTGSTNPATIPTNYTDGGGSETIMACWNQDYRVDSNRYDIGAGLQYPGAMSAAQRVSLESALFHKPDASCTGTLIYYFPVHNITQNTYYTSIQAAINAAGTSDVIEASDGTYNEDVLINKSVTLQGQSVNAIIRGLYAGATKTVTVTANNVTVKNLTITRDYGTTLADWYAAGTKTEGIIAENVSGLTLDHIVVKYNRNGIYIHSVPGFVVKNSTVTDNRTGFQIWGNLDNGQIINNFINNNFTHGLLVNFDQGFTTGNNLQINNNDLSGNWYSQINFQNGAAPGTNVGSFTGFTANCNWYGTTSPAYQATNPATPGYGSQPPSQFGGTDPNVNSDIRGLEAALITYIPFLVNGTDNDAVTPGFQPVPGSCSGPSRLYVNDNSTTGDVYTTAVGNDANSGIPSAPFATIARALLAATPGDSIYVDAGTYNEAVNVNKTVWIFGSQAGVDARTRGIVAESKMVNSAGAFALNADNVVIDGFSIQDQTNGNAAPTFGYAVYMAPSHTGTKLLNSIIKNNIVGSSLANTGASQVIIRRNLFDANNQAGPASGAGIYTDEYTGGGIISNVLIDSNKFTGHTDAGIDFSVADPAKALTGITISANTFDANNRAVFLYNIVSSSFVKNVLSNATGAGTGDIRIFGGVNNFSILNNAFSNGVPAAIRITNDGGSATNSGIAVHENSITGYATFFQVVSGYTGSLDATCNWYGTTDNSLIAPKISGAVTYLPFLTNGTDNELATPGFQPVPGSCGITPKLSATINNVTIVSNANGTDDTGTFTVCNGSNNIMFQGFTDLNNAPGNVKVFQEMITLTNVTVPFCNNCAGGLSVFANPTGTAALNDPSQPGTLVMGFRAFIDDNNNNVIDPGELRDDRVVFTVTVKPAVGTPVFTLGANSSRCSGVGTVTYTATAANSTGITYSLDANSLAAGNTINTVSGAVTYVAGYSGTATITASAAGCAVPVTGTHAVTISADNIPPVIPSSITVFLDATGHKTVMPADVAPFITDNCQVNPNSITVSSNSFDCSNVAASHQAYISNTTNGNQSFQGELGMDFTVNSPGGIQVSQLGAFDHQGNGITGTQSGGVRVAIFKKSTQLIVPGLDVIISGSSDPLISGHRMKTITPVTLAPGDYVIVAKGYNPAELNANIYNGGGPFAAGDNGSGSITFTNRAYNGNDDPSSSFVFPQFSALTDPVAYHAGTFAFTSSTPAPGITIGASDYNGNYSSGVASVTVVDTFYTLLTKNATVFLDATGHASIQASDVFASLKNDCGETITSSTLQVSPSTFDCSNAGTLVQHQAYISNTPNGNQSFRGELGMDFTVNNPNGIKVTQLGAFDHQGNGITGTQTGGIRVAIFNKLNQLIVPGLDVILSGNTDPLIQGHRMKTVPPVTLAPGSYVIVAKGYNASEMNGNIYLGGGPFPSGDNGSGSITFTNRAYNGNDDPSASFAFPPFSATTDPVAYHAGTFSFTDQTGPGTQVTLSATDIYGHVKTATASVTVADISAPVFGVMPTNFTVFLDATGHGSVPSASLAPIISSVTDNCQVDPNSIVISGNSFTCANITGDHQAYISNTPNGNQAFQGELGMDFTVNDPNGIKVTQLGAFDHQGNGITGTQGGGVRVAIFDKATQLKVAGLDVIISGTADPLVSGHRMKTVAPVTLAPGNYVIVAKGYNASELNGNIYVGGGPFASGDNGSGSITFTNRAYNGNDDPSASFVYPQFSALTDPVAYHAGSFAFTSSNSGSGITITARDVTGNQSSVIIPVTVIDTFYTLLTKNATIFLDATGHASIQASDVFSSLKNDCGETITTSTFQVTPSNFDCSNAAALTQHQAYISNTSTGNQAFQGELGMDFTVNNPNGIKVTQLGAFDHQGNGITGTQSGGIRVAIFNKSTQQIVSGLDVTISGNSNPLLLGHRMKTVSPVTLAPGNYVIVAKGYNASELNGNIYVGGGPFASGDNGSGSITFTNRAYNGNDDPSSTFVFPQFSALTDPVAYHAGSFSFTDQTASGTQVTLSATDVYGHVKTATATVTVIDPAGYCTAPKVISMNQQDYKEIPARTNVTLSAYPNPARGIFKVTVTGIVAPNLTVEISDQNGKLVATQTVNTSPKLQSVTVPFNLAGKASGIYYIRAISASGVQTGKMVIEY